MEDKLIKEYFEQVSSSIEVPSELKNKLLKENNNGFIICALASSLVFSLLVISIFFEVAALNDPLFLKIVLP
jgi:hypothetical protein